MTTNKLTKEIHGERIIILSDHQCRYNNLEAEKSVLKLIKDFKPTVIVLNGDIVDFEALGKYPTKLEHRLTVMDDVAAARAMMARLRKAAGKDAKIYFVSGNHEQRLQKYLTSNAPEIEGSLNLPEFLGLSDFDIHYVGEYGTGVDWNGVFIYHGSRVSQHSGYTAKAEFYDAGTSLAHGHTQRLGAFYVTDRVGVHGAFEGGAMCYVEPDKAPPSHRGPKQNNWQNGFLIGYAMDGIWNIYPVSITNNKFIWNGKVYKPD